MEIKWHDDGHSIADVLPDAVLNEFFREAWRVIEIEITVPLDDISYQCPIKIGFRPGAGLTDEEGLRTYCAFGLTDNKKSVMLEWDLLDDDEGDANSMCDWESPRRVTFGPW